MFVLVLVALIAFDAGFVAALIFVPRLTERTIMQLAQGGPEGARIIELIALAQGRTVLDEDARAIRPAETAGSILHRARTHPAPPMNALRATMTAAEAVAEGEPCTDAAGITPAAPHPREGERCSAIERPPMVCCLEKRRVYRHAQDGAPLDEHGNRMTAAPAAPKNG
jgi:hypothetical protein